MDKLGLYNDALRICGERKLLNLTENREPRRLLDDAWDFNAYDTWLEAADWNFALRTVVIGVDPSSEQAFGLRNAYQKPTDMVRISGIYMDEFLEAPLRQYQDEGTTWYTDIDDRIYVRYVSRLPQYGGDIGLWPQSFARFVAGFLAKEIAPRLKNDVNKKSVTKQYDERIGIAKSQDVLKQPSKSLPMGSWRKARLAGSRYDGSQWGRR